MSDRRHDRGAFADHPPRRETARPSARRQSAPNLMQEEWSDGPRKTHQLVQDLATLVPILASTPTEAGEATRIQVTNLTLHVTTAGRDLQLLDTTQRRAISDASDAWLKAHSDSSDCAGLNHDHQQLRTTSEVRTTKTTKLFPTYYQKPSSSLTNNNYIDRKLFPPDMNIRANREAALGTIIRLSLPALDQFGQEIADQDFKESVKSMGVEKMEEVYAYSKVLNAATCEAIRERFHPDISCEPEVNQRMFMQGDFGWALDMFPLASEETKVTDVNFVSTSWGGITVKCRPFYRASQGILRDSPSPDRVFGHFLYTLGGQFREKVPDIDRSNWIEVRDADEWAEGHPEEPQPLHVLLVKGRHVRQGTYMHKVPSLIPLCSPMKVGDGKMTDHSKRTFASIMRRWTMAYLFGITAHQGIEDKEVTAIDKRIDRSISTDLRPDFQRAAKPHRVHTGKRPLDISSLAGDHSPKRHHGSAYPTQSTSANENSTGLPVHHENHLQPCSVNENPNRTLHASAHTPMRNADPYLRSFVSTRDPRRAKHAPEHQFQRSADQNLDQRQEGHEGPTAPNKTGTTTVAAGLHGTKLNSQSPNAPVT